VNAKLCVYREQQIIAACSDAIAELFFTTILSIVMFVQHRFGESMRGGGAICFGTKVLYCNQTLLMI
jgi:hypothetical protein